MSKRKYTIEKSIAKEHGYKTFKEMIRILENRRYFDYIKEINIKVKLIRDD